MNIRSIVVAIAAAGLTGGCASVVEGTTQQVYVASDPAGADCTASNDLGKWPVVTPGVVTVKKSQSVLSVRCSKAGYKDGSYYLSARMSSLAAAGAMMPYIGLIDAAADASSGAAMIYPNQAFVVLKADAPADAAPAQQAAAPQAPAPQASAPATPAPKTTAQAGGTSLSTGNTSKEQP